MLQATGDGIGRLVQGDLVRVHDFRLRGYADLVTMRYTHSFLSFLSLYRTKNVRTECHPDNKRSSVLHLQ
jgi:hypothetical protein